METLLHDVRYALRTLLKSPGFAAVAVLTLALGIGANTAIFSVVNRLMLNPLPFEGGDRIVFLWQTDPRSGISITPELAVAAAWRERARSFEAIELYADGEVLLGGAGEPTMVQRMQVSASFLSFLGLRPELGRMFAPAEARPGGEPVALLGYEFWQRRYGGRGDVLGEPITLDGTLHMIVGVMPARLRLFERGAASDVWTPLRVGAAAERGGSVNVVARLREGFAPEQAKRELDAIMMQVADPSTHERWEARIFRPRERFGGGLDDALVILFAAVGLVLVIACANVAHLLLARGLTRQRELAVRAALGAGRRRLVRALLAESLLLAAAGGAVGLLLAWWSVDALTALRPDSLRELARADLDARVLGFGLALSLLTGLLFGLLPAFNATRVDLAGAVRRGSSASTGSKGGTRLRTTLLVGEIALSVVLLIGAGLLVRSLLHLQRVDPGFDPESLVTVEVTLPPARYASGASRTAFSERLLRRAEPLPGVAAATLALGVPPEYGMLLADLEVSDRELAAGDETSRLDWNAVYPTYFDVLGIRIIDGRSFTADELRAEAPVAIIDETMARRVWPGESAVGARVRTGPNADWRTVVGVVERVAAQGRIARSNTFQLYTPYRDTGLSSALLVVRARGDVARLVPELRNLVHSIDPQLPIRRVTTVEDLLADDLARPRFSMTLLTAFAALAVVLAAVGLFGVLSYAVDQRRREIGIRMAVGADASDVLRLVVRAGLPAVLAGVGLGVLGALLTTRVMRGLLHGVGATDPVTFAGVPLLIAVVAVVAGYVPTRRATRVDPVLALRAE